MKKEELIKHLENYKFPKKIIRAFEEVDREKFVLLEYKKSSYEDTALPIGFNQTISQPYTIAVMLSLLQLRDNLKILEVGSGRGYVLELLSKISKNSKIFGVERIRELAESSKEKLKNIKDIKVIWGNGVKGLKKEAPFDRILVSASAKEIPQKLVSQLKTKGVLIAPVRNSIVVIKKESGESKVKEYPGFSFVPLIEEELF